MTDYYLLQKRLSSYCAYSEYRLRQLPRKKLVVLLDKLCSIIVRLRDKRCVICGTTMNLTCGHYEDRRYEALRWNLINCNTQCETCNGEHNIDRQPYTDWMNENHPLSIEVFKILKLRHIKTTRDDLIEAYELLVEGANHVSESF